MAAVSSSPINPDQPPLAVLPGPISIPPITSVKRSVYSFFGTFTTAVSAGAAEFLASYTDASPEHAARSLEEFLNATHDDCIGREPEKASCWLTLRLTHPSDDFQVPRWHQDGRMFAYDEGREAVPRSKYAITLCGPPTLLLKSSEGMCTLVNQGREMFRQKASSQNLGSLTRARDDEMLEREWLADKLKDAKTVTLGKGEIVRFSWGRDDSPMHSEPDLVTERIFMSVLYGSEAEIHHMCKLRQEEYDKKVIEVYE